MQLSHLEIENFRNIAAAAIDFSPGVNILYGDNAQGKTNILEAIWLFCAGKSFRPAKDRDMIRENCDRARLRLLFYAFGRGQKCEIVLHQDKSKQTLLNGVKLKKLSELFGNVSAVLFAPEHLNIVDEGPEQRRRFLDIAISQLRPRYVADLVRYQKVMSQRNALLKDIRFSADLIPMLDAFDVQAAALADEIVRRRAAYLRRLSPIVSEIYQQMTKSREQLRLSYKASIRGTREEILAALSQNRKEDLLNGYSGIGPHRDDIEFFIDGRGVRLFGSRGQRRSCVICLKLAEQEILKQETGEYPILLLDDIMAELDPARQHFLLNRMDGKQVIITCCDKAVLASLEEGAAFHIAAGQARLDKKITVRAGDDPSGRENGF